MGQFKIRITAVGRHGDRREVGDGAALDLASLPETSIDRVAHDAVEKLKSLGATVETATLTHWPGQAGEVVDDVLNKVRHGSF
jgi:hypothetical protein